MQQQQYSLCSKAGRRLLAAVWLAAGLAAANEPAPTDRVAERFFNAATGESYGAGAVRPDAQQWAWGETNLLKTRSVRLNQLALDRIGHSRKAAGAALAAGAATQAVPLGSEASSEPAATPQALEAGLPSAVDNSTLKFFPPIRSQGSLGSCAQFAAVYYTLTHMTALARDWDAKNGGDQYRFSPKWTYNMLNRGADIGSCHYDAYAIALKHGLATWADFPYDADCRAWCLDPAAWRRAIGVRAAQAGKIEGLGTAEGQQQLKRMLANGYVLTFATYVGSWQWAAIGDDPATSADDAFAGRRAVVRVNGTSVGHVMTIVGYNDDLWVDLNNDGLVTPDEKGALRVANSWGTNWNDNGFCWISYAALATPNAEIPCEGIFWFDEAAWVTARPSYEPKLLAEFTVNHRSRNQLRMSLGVSSVADNAPTATWQPNAVLDRAGGAYAFNGSATAMDGTFCLDLTDLAPATAGRTRYYVTLTDQAAGNPAVMKSCRLIDPVHGWELPSSAPAMTADASSATVAIDCDLYAVPTVSLDAFRAAEGTFVECRSAGGSGTNDVVLSLFENGQWVEVGRQRAATTAGDSLYRFLVPNLAPGANCALQVQDSSGAVHASGSVTVGNFRVQAAAVAGGALALNWESIAGAVYEVQRAEALSGPWSAVARVVADSARSAATPAIDPGRAAGFFKVVRVE